MEPDEPVKRKRESFRLKASTYLVTRPVESGIRDDFLKADKDDSNVVGVVDQVVGDSKDFDIGGLCGNPNPNRSERGISNTDFDKHKTPPKGGAFA